MWECWKDAWIAGAAAEHEKSLRLWMLLDDVDTADDIAKFDDAVYRSLCRQAHQKRWAVMTGDHNMYQKWREAEAYAVPMTPDRVKSSQERWGSFNQGYKQAIKGCVDLLMVQHKEAKGAHNYYHVAAKLIEAEYGVHSDD